MSNGKLLFFRIFQFLPEECGQLQRTHRSPSHHLIVLFRNNLRKHENKEKSTKKKKTKTEGAREGKHSCNGQVSYASPSRKEKKKKKKKIEKRKKKKKKKKEREKKESS